MRFNSKVFLVVLIASIFLAGCVGGKGKGKKYGQSLNGENVEGQDDNAGTAQTITSTITGSGYYHKTGFCNIVATKDFGKIYSNSCTVKLPVCNIQGIFNVAGKEFHYSSLGGGGVDDIPDFIANEFQGSAPIAITVRPFEAANIIEGLCLASLANSAKIGKSYGAPMMIMSKDAMNQVNFKASDLTGKYSILKAYLVVRALEKASLVDCASAGNVRQAFGLTKSVFEKVNANTKICKPIVLQIKTLAN
jgi:hypothetical protein